MRIVLRRLRNALWAYSMFWPDKKYKNYKVEMARASRSFGPARDLDVQIAFLDFVRKELYKGKEKPFWKRVLREKSLERRKWDRKIILALGVLKRKEILVKIKNLLKQALDEKHFLKIIHKKIAKRLNPIKRLEKYVYRPKAVNELHKMRIVNKNLRYTMESYTFLSPPVVTGLLEGIVNIHHSLGHLHDYDVWIDELERRKVSKDEKKERDKLLEFCKDLRKDTYKKFVDLWEYLEQRKLWAKISYFPHDV